MRGGCFVVILCWSVAARAVTPSSVTLEVHHDADADSCPDVTQVQRRVAARLGYEPFVLGAARKLDVQFSRDGAQFVARIHADDRERSLRSPGTDCSALLDPLALTLSLAIDPAGALAAPSPTPVREPLAPQRATPAPVRPTETRSALPTPVLQPVPWQEGAQLGLGAAYGSAPGVAPELTVQGRLRRRAFVLGLEVNAGFTPWHRLPEVETRTMSVRLGVLPCVEGSYFGACALAEAGVMQAFARGVQDPQSPTWPDVSTGLRLQLAMPAAEGVALGLAADASIRWIRTHLTLEEDRVWNATPFRLAVRAFVRFGG